MCGGPVTLITSNLTVRLRLKATSWTSEIGDLISELDSSLFGGEPKKIKGSQWTYVTKVIWAQAKMMFNYHSQWQLEFSHQVKEADEFHWVLLQLQHVLLIELWLLPQQTLGLLPEPWLWRSDARLDILKALHNNAETDRPRRWVKCKRQK